jgi:plasmid stabilization system protein ParE
VTARFLAEALADLDNAAVYYESQQPGLGSDFVREVLRVVEFLSAYPLAGRSMSRHTRRWLTRRFPYGVLYRVRGDELLVVAVMHLSRAPKEWE